ncbi:hypothetical protein [Spirosoma validum]|uniref:Uncharacterized protein n=1 Tax=Spirosoma validum TaxID=2771355 RepID=A0A927GDL1_9BACT|nr:hypothetical protein [Spirosoma validum]MBD2753788.1 hypothetical protein [Spirosoma validum]
MRRYPYDLYASVIASDATPDSNGNYTAQIGTFSKVSVCRDLVNDAGTTVRLDDQTTQVYDYKIVLPKSCPEIAAGTPVEVRDGSQVRAKGQVLRFYRGQLSCQLWV